MKTPVAEFLANEYSEEFRSHFLEVSQTPLQFYSRGYWIIGLNLALFFFGLWSQPMLWSALALSTVIAYQYFRLKKIARGLVINRELEQFRFEQGGEFKINYTIENNSTQPCPPFLISDQTMYLATTPNVLTRTEGLPAHEKTKLTTYARIESPAGRTTMGPFSIRVRDELGLFEVVAFGENENPLEVYQGLKHLGNRHLIQPLDSAMPGDLEIAKRGQGINFLGLREYNEGDPMSRISWPKSTLEDVLMVKDLERDITRRVSLVIDMNPRLQVGYGAGSTIEATKTIANQLVDTYLKANSSVSLFAAKTHVKEITGSQNIEFLKRTISELRPDTKGAAFSLQRVAQQMNPPCLVILVTTYHPENEEGLLRELALLKAEQFEPYVYFVDPEYSAKLVIKKFGSFLEYFKRSEIAHRAIEQRFLRAQVNVTWVQATQLTGQIEVRRHG